MMKIKVEVFSLVIDSLISQTEDRFSEHSLAMVKEMDFFTPSCFKVG